jgi:DNA-binding transcriptional ArsR family regulator
MANTARKVETEGADANPDVFRAIADPTRRALLDALRDGPKPVNRLAAGFDMSRPAISKHLRILKDAGVVEESRHGREHLYALRPLYLQPVEHWLNGYRRFWIGHLDALKTYLEDKS